eukprot:TRINITY_DN14120_c0_g1_i1.p1 TRINITY_DN14120_c0_g1~~TRINITY_DN14120_c0_g1_i1.p1  ORF type:complete len:364 (+),score=84.24 TRINITY_DN14120_c0_g1_i1:35-1093(+)
MAIAPCPADVKWWHHIVAGFVIATFFIWYGVVFGIFRTATGAPLGRTDFLPSSTVSTGVVVLEIQQMTVGESIQFTLTPDALSFPDTVVNENDQKLLTDVNLLLDDAQTTFANGSLLRQITYKTSLSGSFALYPFDTYTAYLSIQLWDGKSFAASDMDLYLNCSLKQLSSFEFSFRSLGQETGQRVVEVTVRRTTLGQVYPVFLIVAFWIILLIDGAVGIALTVYQYRRVEAPLLGMLAALIFALPALRNTAPLGPPIGCLLDYSSFFWAMLTAILTFVGSGCRYLLQGNAPAPAAPAAPAKPAAPPAVTAVQVPVAVVAQASAEVVGLPLTLAEAQAMDATSKKPDQDSKL